MDMTWKRLILPSLSKKQPKTNFQIQGVPATCDWASALLLQEHSESAFFGTHLNIYMQAFCTTEMIESYAAIATGNLPELSTQQVRILSNWVECLLQRVWQNVFHFMYLKHSQWIVMTKPLSQRLTKLLHTLKPVKIIDKLDILRNNWPHDNHADRPCNKKVTACTPNPLSCGGTGGCYGSIPQLGYTYIQVGFVLYDYGPWIR